MIHIQTMAPGPPYPMAVATPTMLPVPTRPESAMANAWNDEIPVFCFLSVENSSRAISPNLRTCTKRVRSEKYSPAPRQRHTNGGLHTHPEMVEMICSRLMFNKNSISWLQVYDVETHGRASRYFQSLNIATSAARQSSASNTNQRQSACPCSVSATFWVMSFAAASISSMWAESPCSLMNASISSSV